MNFRLFIESNDALGMWTSAIVMLANAEKGSLKDRFRGYLPHQLHEFLDWLKERNEEPHLIKYIELLIMDKKDRGQYAPFGSVGGTAAWGLDLQDCRRVLMTNACKGIEPGRDLAGNYGVNTDTHIKRPGTYGASFKESKPHIRLSSAIVKNGKRQSRIYWLRLNDGTWEIVRPTAEGELPVNEEVPLAVARCMFIRVLLGVYE